MCSLSYCTRRALANAVLEKAVRKRLLKPLKGPTEAPLREFHAADVSWKERQENLQLVRQRNAQEPGVLVPQPDVGKIGVKSVTVQKMH